jgi:homoserine O-succinyltransferase/O-acetyltransferase
MPIFFDAQPPNCLKFGLVNNMSDEALKATEFQFTSLLNSAAGNIPVHLSFYTLPGVPRNGLTASHVSGRYSNIEDLWKGRLDGLIVTGREPMTPNLADEPYWDSLTRLLAWAQENCHATVLSCLAAHAAILSMDGIRRVKENDKVFGIFECARVCDHPLTAGITTQFCLPHSRWNSVPEEQLAGCGYKILTRAEDAGVDTFIKQQKNLFVFFQGHPEYESDTLLREYRRDIARYLKGEAPRYPSMPKSYFDATTVQELLEFEMKVHSQGGEGLLPELNAILANKRIAHTWQDSAAGLYRNLLGYICAQKNTALVSKRLKVIAGSEQLSNTSHLPTLLLEDAG